MLYGLVVESELPLWAVPSTASFHDVMVRWETGDTGVFEQSGPTVEELDGEIRLTWPRVARIRIRGGWEILLTRGPEATEDHMRHLVGGVGLGLLLHQRGCLTLHASAVAMLGGAVLFAASKRGGKSTIAAAMRAAGYGILTDDVAAIHGAADTLPSLLPGAGSLNLWPDAASHLDHDFEAWPSSNPFNDKRVSRRTGVEASGPVPVRCVFVLERLANGSRAAVVKRLTVREAFVELMRHSYAFRMVSDPASVPRFTHQCAKLANEIPVVLLRRSWSLDGLPELVRTIEVHAARHAGPALADA